MEKIFQKINEDIKSAMKAKDTLRLETLRMVKSKILLINARGDLTDEEIIKIVLKYAKLLKQSIEEYKKLNKQDEVDKITSELKIVEEYLPKQLSEEEIKQLVKKAIEETGASSQKQMGLIMKKIMSEHAGIDGNLVKKLVSEILG